MSSITEEFDYLKIQMKDILSATDNFDCNKIIGHGGFGPVYKGELSLLTGPTMVAFKRLDRRWGQGSTEFWKEIFMLSRYKRDNLVSLLHFSIEGDERVLVYEYASRGSLDKHLSDASLTWKKRLQICIGAAHALKYLHDPGKTQQRVLHRDIKSANILLDEKWTAKVSDFGLSKIGPAKQPRTFLISNPLGTVGYIDPLCMETGFLSKKSDVYSFGVVLFEVMCGKECCQYDNGKLIGILVRDWKKCYDENKLDDIILVDLKEEIDHDSLITFSTVAYQCLNRDHRNRPTIDKIVNKLELALKQNIPNYCSLILVEISKLAVLPLSYRSDDELISLLCKGILIDEGKRWISVNKNEKIHEMISATQCINGWSFRRYTDKASRFSYIVVKDAFEFKVEVRAQILLPHITYTINLIFKRRTQDLHDGIYLPFLYKLEEEKYFLFPRVVYEREDGWLMAELYQFSSDHKEHDFKLQFLPWEHTRKNWDFEGIEFQPMEHVIHENLEDKNKEEEISNLDVDWEQKLLPNHTDLISISKDYLEWTTEKDIYFLFRKGFLIDDGEVIPSYLWLSVSKKMKIRLMIPARAFLHKNSWRWKSEPESRFEQVAESPYQDSFTVSYLLKKSELLSHTYSAHLIYKLPANFLWREECILSNDYSACVYAPTFFLDPPPPTPSIQSMVHPLYDIPLHSHNLISHPKLRKDGWMELPLFKEDKSNNTNNIYVEFYRSKSLSGLVIQGIELRSL